MQDLNEEEYGNPEIQKQIAELKKNIPGYKPISWQGRMEICDQCPQAVLVGNFAKVCNECGCMLALKVRFPLTSCPLGKW
jgi:hypothetical protein